jgi:NAD(P)-dependent dehydrogenase (short-subunit alcohol dehydrogenase family)
MTNSEEAKSLAGKVAPVTGSTSGIGLGIALTVDGGWTAQ